MSDIVKRSFGYAIEKENVPYLMDHGYDPEVMLNSLQAAYPQFNPFADSFNLLRWQGQQGACQGHSLAQAAQICLVQKTGIQLVFSRACAYYESQRFDGISGDRGSTLSGGQRAAAAGIMLEVDWKYPARYSNARPSNFDTAPKLKFRASRPVDDEQLMYDLLKAGACIQTGFMWNSSFEKAICNSYSAIGSGGGHSTMYYGLDNVDGTRNDNDCYIVHNNSWQNWQNQGRNLVTREFNKEILRRDRNAVFVAYEALNVEFDLNKLTIAQLDTRNDL